jgi:hypothetical protein
VPESIVLRTQPAVVVIEAPREALISLELLASADPELVRVCGDLVEIADQVVYRVTGWCTQPRALLCWLAEDRRPPREGT